MERLSLPFGVQAQDFPETPATARRSDPETSHDAAASVDATELEDEVLCDLRRHGPATTVELAARMRRELVTISPRMKPLELKGLVWRDGKKPNPSGRSAVLWTAALIRGGTNGTT